MLYKSVALIRLLITSQDEHKLNFPNKQTTSTLFKHEQETGHKIDFGSCKQLAKSKAFTLELL